jgi:N utilization substance protein A
MGDLAEQSVEDLMSLEGIDEVQAGKLIMAARAPWFVDEQP